MSDHMLFGRVHDGARSKCDVCDKEVSFSDYVYLCRECRNKLPEEWKEAHHLLVKFPNIRKIVLTDAIETKLEVK